MSTLANVSAIYKLFLETGGELTVTKLVNKLGMPKSSASRMLSQMAEYNLLERDQTKPVYRPSLMILELSHQVRLNHPLIDLMIKTLAEVCKSSGFTSYVSKLDHDSVLVIHAQIGTQLLQVITQPGTRLPVTNTSTGRALLSRLPPNKLQKFLPANVDELLIFKRTLDTINQRGWSQSTEEAIPGVASISSAVYDPSKDETLTLCVSFPSAFANPETIKDIATMVYKHAYEIGRAVGDPYWLNRPAQPSI